MALNDRAQVEALADNLTECANSIHERLIDAIKKDEIDQYTAQTIFQDEATLRQRANSLYLDAINCVVDGLPDSQESILQVVAEAKDTLKTVKKIEVFIDLIADLLVLATAAYAAKPAPIFAALKEIKSDVKQIKKVKAMT